MQTIVISKGNQYDSDGYSIEAGTLRAWGKITDRMDGTVGVSVNGTWGPGREDMPQVEAAIRDVLADGITRTVTIGRPAVSQPADSVWRSERGLTLTQEMEREDTVY